ncbi:1662_t:CDS:2, partial [Acaulospora colombiana]
MQICRAEDGQIYQVNTTLYDIAKLVSISSPVYIVGCTMSYPSSLRPYLSSLTSIDPAAMIMFLSDGQQLREDNLRELSGVQDQTIFVFNRDYLDLETEEVMELLSVKEGEGLIPSGSIEVDSVSSLHASQILEDQVQWQ